MGNEHDKYHLKMFLEKLLTNLLFINNINHLLKMLCFFNCGNNILRQEYEVFEKIFLFKTEIKFAVGTNFQANHN